VKSPIIELSVTVNGEERIFRTSINKSIFDVLRTEGYVDVKNGCLVGDCGSCVIEVDGRPVLGCCLMAPSCEGTEITTCAGLGHPGALHPLQEAFLDNAAAQCGFCTPGLLISAKCLLDRNSNPTDDEIRDALAGNLCRCTGYVKIIDAVRAAAEKMRGGNGRPGRLRGAEGKA
jgi:carbon-monoxide dehydrogenase small subunit